MSRARLFSFSEYGLQECVFRRESGTLDLVVVLSEHAG